MVQVGRRSKRIVERPANSLLNDLFAKERNGVPQIERKQPQIVQAEQMRELAAEKPSALLCFEREPAQCHRSLLIAAVARDATVTHLFP